MRGIERLAERSRAAMLPSCATDARRTARWPGLNLSFCRAPESLLVAAARTIALRPAYGEGE
jgi:hypothetical protein